MTDAEFSQFLASRGLAAAVAPDTMRDLQRRYGTKRWYGFMDAVYLPPASLFPEHEEPFFFIPSPTCLLPPGELESDFDFHRDGPRTHALALERLTGLFGTPEKGIAVNTLSETWTFERMSLTIRTFLQRETRGHNSLYQAHPELWNHCRISIACHQARPITAEQVQAFRTLDARSLLRIDDAEWPVHRYPQICERGLLVMSPDEILNGKFLWTLGAHLGWCAGRLALIVERERALSLKLSQVTPARSSGYSRLVLTIRNPFSLEQEPVEVSLLAGPKANSLDDSARRVSAFWQIPLTTEEYPDD